jgi:hypothetical protein
MSNVNDFLPFCATDTGTNLIEQAAWVASAARPIGNQPGIASSAFNNKALRQGTYVVSQLAQYISNFANVSTLDNATPAQLLAQMMGTFQPLAPVVTQYLSGTGTWNATFYFFCAAANATAGATYTNNSVTYTVSSTISSGLIIQATGNGTPSAGGGTLTKASGTGDSTITFYAFRQALHLEIEMVGGGGGGGGGGTSGAGSAGSSGGNTTFGSSFLTCDGGSGGAVGFTTASTGGAATIGSGPVGIAIAGSGGNGGFEIPVSGSPPGDAGGAGGASPFGGAGASPGGSAAANSGSGGGGGYGSSNNGFSGAGGASGGYIKAIIYGPSASYVYAIGSSGTGGSGTGGAPAGGPGGSGLILVKEIFQ